MQSSLGKKLSLLLGLGAFWGTFLPSLGSATECLGPKDAKQSVVYLHGIDGLKPGGLEKQNRARLKAMAEKLQIRIALPRSPQACQGDANNLCWNPIEDSPANAQKQLEAALSLSQSCFSGENKPHLLAFSSGGYLANKILRYCLKSGFASVTSVGAASATSKDDPKDLSACEPLRLLVSTTESTRGPAEVYTRTMQERGGQIRLEYFKGNHELPLEETSRILSEQLMKELVPAATKEVTSPASSLSVNQYLETNCLP